MTQKVNLKTHRKLDRPIETDRLAADEQAVESLLGFVPDTDLAVTA